MAALRKIFRFIRAHLARRIERYDVLVEDHVELKNCVLIGPIEIGYRSYANETLIRNARIGRFCSIGRRCSIGATRHDVDCFTTHPFGAPADFLSGPQTVIGNDVWIGDNVVIVAGASIGDGACIGGGAVVTRNVEPYAIVAGVPARPLRWRFEPGVVHELVASQWWKYGDRAVLLGREAASPAALAAALAQANLEPMPTHFRPWTV